MWKSSLMFVCALAACPEPSDTDTPDTDVVDTDTDVVDTDVSDTDACTGTVHLSISRSDDLVCSGDADCSGPVYAGLFESEPTQAQLPPVAGFELGSITLDDGGVVEKDLVDAPCGTFYLSGFMDTNEDFSEDAPQLDSGDLVPTSSETVTIGSGETVGASVVLAYRI